MLLIQKQLLQLFSLPEQLFQLFPLALPEQLLQLLLQLLQLSVQLLLPLDLPQSQGQ